VDVLTFATETMMGIAATDLADGRITKEEAGNRASRIVSGAKRISIGTARAAITLIAETMKQEIKDISTPSSNQLEAGTMILNDLIVNDDDGVLDGVLNT
jgi:hypothetical protein